MTIKEINEELNKILGSYVYFWNFDDICLDGNSSLDDLIRAVDFLKQQREAGGGKS